MKIFLDHIVLNVEDVDLAVKFYQEIIGLKPERLDEYHKGEAPFPSMRINADTVVDIFPPHMWLGKETGEETHSNLNHFCLTLDFEDWKALIERLESYDIKIHRSSDNNWGAKGVGVSVYFYDVDGNEIEARYYDR